MNLIHTYRDTINHAAPGINHPAHFLWGPTPTVIKINVILSSITVILSHSILTHQLQSPVLPSVGPRCSSDVHRSPQQDWPVFGWTLPSPGARPPSLRCCCSQVWPERSWQLLPVGLIENSGKEGLGFYS